MNYSLCANNWGVPEPPKNSPNCAVSSAGNMSAILKSCCHNGPIANYSRGPEQPTYCFQYCNITDPTLSYIDVQSCISNQITIQNISVVNQTTEITCGPGVNKTSIASTNGMNKLVWTLVGIVALQAAVV
jgi:hypothetical protein